MHYELFELSNVSSELTPQLCVLHSTGDFPHILVSVFEKFIFLLPGHWPQLHCKEIVVVGLVIGTRALCITALLFLLPLWKRLLPCLHGITGISTPLQLFNHLHFVPVLCAEQSLNRLMVKWLEQLFMTGVEICTRKDRHSTGQPINSVYFTITILHRDPVNRKEWTLQCC